MAHVKSHEDLDVRQVAMQFAEDCHKLSSGFPADERFGLAAQLRRSAVSVPCTIAEGFGRGQTGGFLQFLRISQGSLREAETQIALAVRLDLATSDEAKRAKECSVRVSKMLLALVRSSEQRKADSPSRDAITSHQSPVTTYRRNDPTGDLIHGLDP